MSNFHAGRHSHGCTTHRPNHNGGWQGIQRRRGHQRVFPLSFPFLAGGGSGTGPAILLSILSRAPSGRNHPERKQSVALVMRLSKRGANQPDLDHCRHIVRSGLRALSMGGCCSRECDGFFKKKEQSCIFTSDTHVSDLHFSDPHISDLHISGPHISDLHFLYPYVFFSFLC